MALWQAANPVARDFRLEEIGPAYRRSAVEERGNGVYIAKSPEPAQGWVAYFIELTFPSGGLFPFKFTTGVRVAPDVLPFGPPPEMVSSRLAAAAEGDHPGEQAVLRVKSLGPGNRWRPKSFNARRVRTPDKRRADALKAAATAGLGSDP